MSESLPRITQLLHEVRDAREGAVDRLATAVYDQLRGVAAMYLRRERPDHTLQPTALVHDAFLRLVDQHQIEWNDRTHYFAVAATVMRRILVDHARRTNAAKRRHQIVTLDDALAQSMPAVADVLHVDEALHALAQIDPRQARIVELRFFAGLSRDETAEALGISPATVTREWAVARAWLHAELLRD